MFKTQMLAAFVVLLSIAAVSVSDNAETASDARRPKSDEELRYWLENMAVYHQYTVEELSAATGLRGSEIEKTMKRYAIDRTKDAPRDEGRLTVRPYPGGRHPRIGFLEGAIRPQRETKFSVFSPWKSGGYVVVDAPEAIWWMSDGERELLYLAHTHIDTHWTKQGVELQALEWTRHKEGRLSIERRLPNGVSFAAEVVPQKEHVAMSLSITNKTDETLTGLRVQNCVMFKGLPGFEKDDGGETDKFFKSPYAARKSADGDRWVITAWQPCQRTWANARCPCLHSDPQFPDCKPGETERVAGRLWFYQGDDVAGEIARLDQQGWRE